MPPTDSSPLIGTLLHAVGAASAALCYAPQHYLRKWSWQTYWLMQALVCWFILPWVFAWLTVPHLGQVLAQAPGTAMWHSYLLGAVYGIGGIAFGVAIRYVGYSLTYAISIGISCVLGTLLPPLVQHTLGATLAKEGGRFVVAGVVIGGIAILVTGLAGFRKERELARNGQPVKFNARIGLPICLLAGVFSAVFNFSLEAGQPVADVAARFGAGHFQSNVIYIFSNSGAFTTTLFYVGWMATRQRTWSEFIQKADLLPRNYALAALTGLLWYMQFFFYGLGHTRMGSYKFSSWAIHMTILILFSCGFGVLIGEWKRCRPQTKWLIAAAIVLLVSAVGILTYGNYLGNSAA